MSFIDDILNALAEPLRQYSHPPAATLLVLGAAIVLSLITMAANRFLVNYNTVVTAIGSIPVAYAPLVLPFTTTTKNGMFSVLSLFYWYLICSFTLSIPLSRLFGVQSSFSMTPTSGESS